MYKIGDKVVVSGVPAHEHDGSITLGSLLTVVDHIPGSYWITDTEVQLDCMKGFHDYTFVPWVEQVVQTFAPVVGNTKYNREIKPGTFIDVYDVLYAFKVTDPCLQHLIKKALAVGQRGHKDNRQDLVDIRDSAQRALDSYDLWEGK
jgi:hypothetical protein